MKDDIIFIRTSTIEQTPELQLGDITRAFNPSSYIILEERESAFKENSKRYEFERLKKLIASNKVNVLYVWDLDRLFRNRKRLISFLELCKNYNTKIYSYNQQWLTKLQEILPPFNEIMYEFMLQIMGWIAEEESIKKSNRVKMAVRKNTNGITFSYKGNKWGRKTLSKQVTTKVKELKDLGLSIRQIAAQVMVYDKSNNGRNISKSAVHKILSFRQEEKDSF
jgi:DNA invertase Pin-like site-specific DNA recombinase